MASEIVGLEPCAATLTRPRSVRKAKLQPDSELCDKQRDIRFFAFNFSSWRVMDLTQRPFFGTPHPAGNVASCH